MQEKEETYLKLRNMSDGDKALLTREICRLLPYSTGEEIQYYCVDMDMDGLKYSIVQFLAYHTHHS